MDDIRETIINYEDEGGGERDTGNAKIVFFINFISNNFFLYRLRLECVTWSSNL